MSTYRKLYPREREIMDVIYLRGEASAAEVLKHLSDPPSYSTIRAMLRKLEAKGMVVHHQEGLRYVYRAAYAREHAQESAIRRLLQTFFDESPVNAVAAILDRSSGQLSEEQFDELASMVERARKQGR